MLSLILLVLLVLAGLSLVTGDKLPYSEHCRGLVILVALWVLLWKVFGH